MTMFDAVPGLAALVIPLVIGIAFLLRRYYQLTIKTKELVKEINDLINVYSEMEIDSYFDDEEIVRPYEGPNMKP